METPTEERVALVTGAARGIGAAVVRRLAADGLRVVAVDACLGADHGLPGVRHDLATRADLDRAVAAAGSPDRVTGAVADVRDRAALARVADDAVAGFGRLDVVVAGAAVISGGSPLWETPAADLAALWEVDVLGVAHTVAATVPHLLACPDPAAARVVALASAASERGLFHLAGYSAAKHGVVGLVRALAEDLAGTGVVATAVAPGSTRTDLLAATAALYDVPPEQLAEAQATGMLEPADIADVVAFCLTPAGRSLHGATVPATGGFR